MLVDVTVFGWTTAALCVNMQCFCTHRELHGCMIVQTSSIFNVYDVIESAHQHADTTITITRAITSRVYSFTSPGLPNSLFIVYCNKLLKTKMRRYLSSQLFCLVILNALCVTVIAGAAFVCIRSVNINSKLSCNRRSQRIAHTFTGKTRCESMLTFMLC